MAKKKTSQSGKEPLEIRLRRAASKELAKAKNRKPVAASIRIDGQKFEQRLADGFTRAGDIAGAAHNGFTAVVTAYLETGANIDRTIAGGDTLLTSAAAGAQKRVVRALLKREADVNALNRKGASALVQVLSQPDKNYRDLANELLAAGADPNIGAGHKGSRALHLAARLADVALIDQLLEHGADSATRDDAGELPRDVVGKATRMQVISHGNKPFSDQDPERARGLLDG